MLSLDLKDGTIKTAFMADISDTFREDIAQRNVCDFMLICSCCNVCIITVYDGFT